MENLDVMLGTYSRNEVHSQLSENEENIDQRSNERQTNTNPVLEAVSSEIISDAVRMINIENTSQVSSKLNKFKADLNLHIRETIEQVI